MGLFDSRSEGEKAAERQRKHIELCDEASRVMKEARSAGREGDFHREDKLMAKADRLWAKANRYSESEAFLEDMTLAVEWKLEQEGPTAGD
jgi:hypothetical protein